jgi:DNA polymerase-3 subunit epsilon
MRQVFLDTETTGLSAYDGDRVIEVGCVEMVDRKITGRHVHLYVNPERASHPDALKVHGLTQDFLSLQPLFSAVVDHLLSFIEGAEVIIHNASFDLAFLNKELARVGRSDLQSSAGRVTDSLKLARSLYPGKSNSLDALCKRFEVNASARTNHGALLDAALLAEVYLRMTRGQKVLAVDTQRIHQGPVSRVARAQLAVRTVVLPAMAEELELHRVLVEDMDAENAAPAIWSTSVDV